MNRVQYRGQLDTKATSNVAFDPVSERKPTALIHKDSNWRVAKWHLEKAQCDWKLEQGSRRERGKPKAMMSLPKNNASFRQTGGQEAASHLKLGRKKKTTTSAAASSPDGCRERDGSYIRQSFTGSQRWKSFLLDTGSDPWNIKKFPVC